MPGFSLRPLLLHLPCCGRQNAICPGFASFFTPHHNSPFGQPFKKSNCLSVATGDEADVSSVSQIAGLVHMRPCGSFDIPLVARLY